ncbi:hypothetical protein K2X33_09550 [bacterium]|nr:hypothetical protein [bacterium]
MPRPPVDSTTNGIVTTGLAMHLDAARADGTLPGACSNTDWTDLVSGSLTGLTCATAWKGSGTSADPYRVEFDGSYSASRSFDYTQVRSDFTIELWVVGREAQLAHTQAATGNFSGEHQQLAFSPEVGSIAGSDAVAGVAVGANSVEVYEHGTAHFAPVLVYPGNFGSWKHLTVAFTANRATLYVNGASVATGEVSTKIVSPTFTGVGGGGSFGYFNGSLAVVRVYSRTLSDAEILQNYNFEKDRFAGTDADSDGSIAASSGGGDCDESDANVNPSANEVCADSIDNNCDGTTDPNDECGIDADTDGYTSIATGGNDCDDTDASISPAALDYCGDGIDQDCNSADSVCLVDGENFMYTTRSFVYHSATPLSWPEAALQCNTDGGRLVDIGNQDQNDSLARRVGSPMWIGHHDTAAEGVWANACDNSTYFTHWESAPDGSTAENCAEFTNSTVPGEWGDTDCMVAKPYLCEFGGGVCGPDVSAFDIDGDGQTPDAGDCDDFTPSIYVGAAENCSNSADDNCNGQTDCSDTDCALDADGDGVLSNSSNASCGTNSDCDDSNANVNSQLSEACDGVDNDCDTAIDEGCDDDGDDYTDTAMGGDDCDDADALINPGRLEVCDNGRDDDCSGGNLSCIAPGQMFGVNSKTFAIGNPVATWLGAVAYCESQGWQLAVLGSDADSKAVASLLSNAVWIGATNPGSGYVNVCNNPLTYSRWALNHPVDNCASLDPAPSGEWYSYSCTTNLYPLCEVSSISCVNSPFSDRDGDGSTELGGDCNDFDNILFPGAGENCSDAIDNNCDFLVDCADPICGVDVDGDSYRSFANGCGSDCNDNNATAYPGATELFDTVDNDCDGFIDEGLDQDGDGYADIAQGGNDCDDSDGTVHPGAGENCNSGFIDEDCDGQPGCGDTDCAYDGDHDNYGVGAAVCVGTGDCDDTNATVNSGAPEICDGVDNDCDGQTDELCDGDGDGYITVAMGGNDCDDTHSDVHPGGAENCIDGRDNDCDGQADCSDSDCLHDNDGDGSYAGDSSCNPQDCNDASASFPTTEVCDGVDNDCDTVIDEGCDMDGDNYTDHNQGGNDCDDSIATINPGMTENCSNSTDENCNGLADCADVQCFVDLDGDGYGTGDFACTANGANADCADWDPSIHPGQGETCFNGTDDNCDGQVDEGC